METVLLYLLGVAVIVIGLALSVALHELGHFIPAKLFKVKVTKFMIGFGPTLFSRTKGETEYGVKAIPLGGYVAMIGMYPPAAPGEAPREASTGFVQAIGEHSAGALPARRPSRMSALIDEARTASAETIGEGEDHRAFYRLPVWKRMIVMLGGPAMNILLGIVFYAILLMGFGLPMASTTLGTVSECALPATSDRDHCLESDPPAPAASAGLEPGDTIISIAGTPIEVWQDLSGVIREHAAETIPFVIERDGTRMELAVTPILSERFVFADDGTVLQDAAGNPVTEQVGFIGITPLYLRQLQGPDAVLPAVGGNIAAVTEVIVNLPQRLVGIAQAAFGPDERDPNGPISVVGVGRIAGEVASSSWPVVDRVASMVGLLAALNIALAIFNLIPLPPLDGGHVAGALYEALRRFFAKLFGRPDPGPVDTAKLMPVTLTMVAILGAMTLLLIYADIVKPITLG